MFGQESVLVWVLRILRSRPARPWTQKLLEMLDFDTPTDSSCVAVRTPLARICA